MRVRLLMMMVGLVFSGMAFAQPRPQKKLIEYGWDVPYPEFIQAHIRQMETRPFDGLIFKLHKFDHGFDTRPWNAEELKPQIDTLRGIEWKRFTDNFVMLFAANKSGMDWFNDAQWKTIEENLKVFATAVKAGKCAGVCFDPEPYGEDPWVFKGRFEGRSLAQVWEQARRRGRQFIGALQSGAPEVKVLSFFQLSLFGHRLNDVDERKRTEAIANDGYALWVPFYIGMLEGAAPGVSFIDGNENSYYYDSPEQYFRAYQMMRRRAQALVPVELRKKYNAQCQAGVAVYLDQVFGLRANAKIPGSFMNPAEQAKFLEHNTYYALDSTDEYVWVYGEKLDWWGTTKAGGRPVLPGGMEAALGAARKKYEAGQPLGFEIGEMVGAARKRMSEKQ